MITDVIDLSHNEAAANIPLAARQGLQAVIMKSTQGKDYVDPAYNHIKQLTVQSKLLFGSFHFGSNSSTGVQQANWFLANSHDGGLLCLDRETNPDLHGGTMTLANAEAFVTEVHRITNVWPVYYSYLSFTQNDHIPATSVLRNCPLWLACYGSKPKTPSPWKSMTLWQYTDAGAGPRDMKTYPRVTPGLGLRCDRSAFFGTLAELQAGWKVGFNAQPNS